MIIDDIKKLFPGREKAGSEPADDAAGSYSIETENLAVPEIHTGKVDTDACGDDADDASANDAIADEDIQIQYDTLAVPEIHIRSRK